MAFARDVETGEQSVVLERGSVVPIGDVRLNLTAVKVLVDAQRRVIQLAEEAQQEPYVPQPDLETITGEEMPQEEAVTITAAGQSVTLTGKQYDAAAACQHDIALALATARKLGREPNHEMLRRELGWTEGRAIRVAKALETDGVPA